MVCKRCEGKGSIAVNMDSYGLYDTICGMCNGEGSVIKVTKKFINPKKITEQNFSDTMNKLMEV